jgi:hypothetical protein
MVPDKPWTGRARPAVAADAARNAAEGGAGAAAGANLAVL